MMSNVGRATVGEIGNQKNVFKIKGVTSTNDFCPQ